MMGKSSHFSLCVVITLTVLSCSVFADDEEPDNQAGVRQQVRHGQQRGAMGINRNAGAAGNPRRFVGGNNGQFPAQRRAPGLRNANPMGMNRAAGVPQGQRFNAPVQNVQEGDDRPGQFQNPGRQAAGQSFGGVRRMPGNGVDEEDDGEMRMQRRRPQPGRVMMKSGAERRGQLPRQPQPIPRQQRPGGKQQQPVQRMQQLRQQQQQQQHEARQSRRLQARHNTVDTQSMFCRGKKMTGTIDVWWLHDDGGLTILLPHLMTLSSQWHSCKLRVFTSGSSQKITSERLRMTTLLNKFRIEFSSVEIITDMNKSPSADSMERADHLPGWSEVQPNDHSKQKMMRQIRIGELIRQNSRGTALVVVTLPVARKREVSNTMYMSWLEALTMNQSVPILLVRGNQSNVITFYS
eukprot:scpid49549/ scgid15607/ Solute carrier family 12 member 1; Bumetanide-sensitive sodium-(potassium)-chloride cotransporter 2; Kidney-specific Na-K-Cl symporter